ncbi:MAG: bifunctional 5,10-methylenetetrahydrofolate dehydrogenase/5,10-methenyltetrahydrofolate cyclohydrolase [Candidatus Wolfebacteria bacterium]|nr:bifunctional 5,10-methylenetetrahydrofolate dehydrogenase/5,10-methenyltetrahydrofolate cyclohydrolase [Candidatus Wolfebacteria bacterium]
MQAINGKEIAQKIIENLKNKPKPEKILAVIKVGENPASESFIKQKEKVAKELKVDFRLYDLNENISQDDLRKEVVKLANLKKVGGIIIQLPLPKHINNQYVLNVIPREKDIDVLGERSLGAFYAGRNPVLPPSVATVEELLRATSYKLQVVKVAVVGLGQLVGKPIAVWLIKKCKELYLLDQGSDLGILKQADLVILGVGKAEIIRPDMLKESASVIDFGYERSEGQTGAISGDFDASALLASGYSLMTGFYTRTPGGTGPVLVAKIFENFYTLNNENE